MYKRALSNLERTLFSPERALKLRSTLSKVRSALRAHSERIQSGYTALVRGEEKYRADQSGYRSDTDER